MLIDLCLWLSKGSFDAARLAAELLSTEHSSDVVLDGDPQHRSALQDALKEFALEQLGECSTIPQVREVQSLCGKCPRLLDQVTSSAVRALEELLQVPQTPNDAQEYVVGSRAKQSLLLLTTCFWSSCLPPTQDLLSIFHKLLQLLANVQVSVLARDALLALIPHLGKDIDIYNDGGTLHRHCDLIWQQIRHLVSGGDNASCSFNACSLWLRLLSVPCPFFPTLALLKTSDYWQLIRQGLSAATVDRRKVSLSLLRLSLNVVVEDIDNEELLLEIVVKEDYLSHYARFCHLYETIVFGRYLNQVQECLGDLTAMTTEFAKVRPLWLLALLSAAMSDGMAESIQSLLGHWLVCMKSPTLHVCMSKETFFLSTSFLPWVTNGSLFRAGVSAESQGVVVCSHGEQLATFVQNLVSSTDAPQSIIRVMLGFLADRGQHIIAFAKAYILLGLIRGLEHHQAVLVDLDVALVLQIARSGGVQVIVGDFITMQCVRLCSYAPHMSSTHAKNFDVLRKTCKSWEAVAAVDTVQLATFPEDDRSITHLHLSIRESAHKVLRGSGLQQTMIRTISALNLALASDADSQALVEILSAIWAELEIQDYPRRAIMHWPKLFLHPSVIRHCSKSSILRELVTDYMLRMIALTQNKIYIFVAFVEQLRKTALESPHITELPLAECIMSFAKTPPITRSEFYLEAAMAVKLAAQIPGRDYEYYYGNAEGYGWACYFDMLNRLPYGPGFDRISERSMQGILEPWIDQKHPVPVISKWKSSVQLQVVLLLLEHRLEVMSETDVGAFLACFHEMLMVESVPRLRHLLQWAIVRILVQYRHRREDVLRILDEHDLSSNPKYGAALMQIGRAIACLADTEKTFVARFLIQLVPLSASPKIILRHEAQWTFPVVFNHSRINGWTDLVESPGLASLHRDICKLDSYANPPPQRQHEAFEFFKQHNLSTLLEGDYLLIEPTERARATQADFSLLSDLDNVPAGRMIMGSGGVRQSQIKGHALAMSAAHATTFGSTIPIQTKSLAPYDDLSTSLYGGGSIATNGSDVILVASLVDNAFNIGGLSRTGEIFGVSSMQVRSLKVLKNKDFTSVSVSSEGHIKIEELSVVSVVDFITRGRLDGYTAIGVEQTDSSKILGQTGWSFPSKVILVMGSEREGIAPEVLAAVDFCVEIKQVGQTRSLNVQTAAAVVLYEISRQHSCHI